MQPPADSPNPADAPPAEPPRSWLAVAALLEQHGFGELAMPGDDPFDDDRETAAESAPDRRR